MTKVTGVLSRNRLDIVLGGISDLPEIEHLALVTLREAAVLRQGFDVTVDARELHFEDQSIVPIMGKIFRSLQWFGIGVVFHLGAERSSLDMVKALYGQTGLFGTVRIEVTQSPTVFANWQIAENSQALRSL